uniref:FHA domain-containing protein n=1 Tax=Noccaea caerulescens TaxID=107243 RepID=A0A1J3I1D3_NOCCA
MVPPLLKLAFVQGPREGDSLEYKPGSIVRIGRILRGNEIGIKDAGISTKHLRIDSESENWRIFDLGSSNGTILNSDTLDPHTHVNLRHGDVIKLGEYTSIVVNFETDVQAEHKLPPMPRRSNRRLPVADPDPVPMESVHEKPTGKGKSAKQDADEPRRRGRPPKRKAMEEIADKEKESDVNCRVTRSRKKVAITKEEEEAVPLEKKGNSRARGGKKNTEAAQNLGLNSIKLEMEDTPISAMKKRATRSRQIGNESMGSEENIKSKSEDTDTALEEKRPTRATRSKRKEIGGDVVPNQAPKSRAKKRKTESKSVVEEMEARNDDDDDDDEDKENEKDVVEPQSDKKDETSKSVELEQVEIELRNSRLGEEDLSSSVREDGEAEIEEEREYNGEVVAGTECERDEEKAEQELRNKKNVDKLEVDLEKMTLGDWFKFMRVQLRKQIVDETEKLIEPMTSKSLRVHQHIAQHKQAKGKGSVS